MRPQADFPALKVGKVLFSDADADAEADADADLRAEVSASEVVTLSSTLSVARMASWSDMLGSRDHP